MTDYSTSQTATLNISTNSRVAPGVSIGSFSVGDAIVIRGGANLDLYGSAFGDDTGVYGVDAGILRIFATGSAISTDANTGAGVFGRFQSVFNSGSITGPNGISLSDLNAGTVSIENKGLISGATNAFATSVGSGVRIGSGPSNTPASATLVNTGTIEGSKAYTSHAGENTITNYGIMKGNGVLGNAIRIVTGTSSTLEKVTLINYGTLAADYSAIIGGRGNDSITNSGLIIGDSDLGEGDDTYSGIYGRVQGTIGFGAGADRAVGGVYADNFAGGGGDDTLDGGGGNDVLDGQGDNDELYGEDGNDALTGGAGSDILDGGAGDDRLTGGSGDDTFYVDSARDRVFEIAGGGADKVFTTVSFTLAAGHEIEELVADPEAGNIGLIGNGFANTLTGNAGNNRLDGGALADTMVGGAGDDTYYVDNSDDVVTEVDDEGADTIFTTIDFALPDHVENLRVRIPASTAGFILDGNALDNLIVGSAGNDLIYGGGGADRMLGGAGNDIYDVDDVGDTVGDTAGFDTVASSVSYRLGGQIEALQLSGDDDIDGTGNAGSNVVTGNGADNILSGLGGADLLIGNAGDDTFLFNSKLDPTNVDQIFDFTRIDGGEQDRIALDDIFFRGIGAPPAFGEIALDARFFAVGEATTREHRIIYDEDYEFPGGSVEATLLYDPDGSGTKYVATPFAILCGCTPLSAGDFIVV